MTSLRVIECGPGTSVQDLGRFGYRRFGVSTAGVMDRQSAAIANALVGNEPGSACIEFNMMGGRFLVVSAPVLIGVVGAGTVLRIGGKKIQLGRSAYAGVGETIEVGAIRGGVFSYLAVSGGFNMSPEMGSLSVHRRSAIGGRVFISGDLLPIFMAKPSPAMAISIPRLNSDPIRVVPGPQEDHFLSGALRSLCDGPYTVKPDSDRMGYRLSGQDLHHAANGNIVSDGVLPGSIQVPGDGQPIVLLRDCQTTGGYPKIATVISADIDRLAQIPPGGVIRFTAVSLEQAVTAVRAANAEQSRLLASAGPAIIEPTTDALLRTNLIDGATDGSE